MKRKSSTSKKKSAKSRKNTKEKLGVEDGILKLFPSLLFSSEEGIICAIPVEEIVGFLQFAEFLRFAATSKQIRKKCFSSNSLWKNQYQLLTEKEEKTNPFNYFHSYFSIMSQWQGKYTCTHELTPDADKEDEWNMVISFDRYVWWDGIAHGTGRAGIGYVTNYFDGRGTFHWKDGEPLIQVEDYDHTSFDEIDPVKKTFSGCPSDIIFEGMEF